MKYRRGLKALFLTCLLAGIGMVCLGALLLFLNKTRQESRTPVTEVDEKPQVSSEYIMESSTLLETVSEKESSESETVSESESSKAEETESGIGISFSGFEPEEDTQPDFEETESSSGTESEGGE